MFKAKWTIKKFNEYIYLYIANEFYDEIYSKLSTIEWVSLEKGSRYIVIGLLVETYEIDEKLAIDVIEKIVKSVYSKNNFAEFGLIDPDVVDDESLIVYTTNDNTLCITYYSAAEHEDTNIYLTRKSAIAIAKKLLEMAKE